MPDEIEWNFDIDDGLLAVAYVEHGLTEREVHPDCPELAQAVRAALLIGEQWRPHDLRRTGATCMAELGALVPEPHGRKQDEAHLSACAI